ncbi:MAG TPA: arginine deiminase family protein [Clostridia bacterium]|nr:arginine deiminase family protein [Clostridia bacterium]
MEKKMYTDEMMDLDQIMLNGETLPDIKAIGGERWFPLYTTIEEDMATYWGGDWGCSSEVNRLRAVLLHRPGVEIENFDYDKVRFRAPIDPVKFRAQFDALADYYRSQGVAVYLVDNGRADRPNSVFCRDKLFMTPEGAIIARLAMAERRGEERFVAETCARLGVPIVKTIAGDGIFEGANASWVDRHTVILSLSVRANRSGYDQVAAELRRQGVTDILTMQIPYGHAHIDGLLNFASNDLVMLHACQVPYEVVDALKKKGYHILETPSLTETKYGYATNFVAIEPGHVVSGNLAPRSVELLEKHGVKVDVLNLSELNKGRGSVHCATAFLKRDSD